MQLENETNRYLRPEAVAKRLGLSRVTVYRLLKKGELAHYKIAGSLLLTERHVEEFLAKRERQASA